MERQKYYKHAQKAKMTKQQKYMSMIIDGMDQSKTALPHFVRECKQTSQMVKVKTHLTGVIVHGLQDSWGFFDCDQFPHASNLTINVLINVLSMYDSLPPVLYLQLDNCYRENKNKYVIAFCCLLVELGIFKKIKIGFLMVGHTHEDVDQLFSRFSVHFNRNDAKCLPSLLDRFEHCYSPSPSGIILERLFNVSDWLEKHIEKIEYHTMPHQFKIFCDPSGGKAKLMYKLWSTDSTWLECEGDAGRNPVERSSKRYEESNFRYFSSVLQVPIIFCL